MLDIPPESVTDPRPLHPDNTPLPIELTESGMVMDDNPTQLLNALLPISDTLEGIVMPPRLPHPLNALAPMEETPSGILTEPRLEHPSNISSGMADNPPEALHSQDWNTRKIHRCQDLRCRQTLRWLIRRILKTHRNLRW